MSVARKLGIPGAVLQIVSSALLLLLIPAFRPDTNTCIILFTVCGTYGWATIVTLMFIAIGIISGIISLRVLTCKDWKPSGAASLIMASIIALFNFTIWFAPPFFADYLSNPVELLVILLPLLSFILLMASGIFFVCEAKAPKKKRRKR